MDGASIHSNDPLDGDNRAVLRYATGATRNLIYENSNNKAALVDAGGVARLVSILSEADEELRKTVTGVLWNLSSRDNLKEKLSREALSELTEKVLVPLCNSTALNASEREIFYNTTGCLRNLSYQLYSELPPSVRLRLEGPRRATSIKDSEAIGCFTLYSKKDTERHENLSILSEMSRQPKGADWLWHPKVVALYKLVLQSSDSNSTGREAAIGALQNITAGETRWASVLSGVVLEQERMLPILLDLLDTNSEMELRPLTGLLRNLARHSSNKDHMATNVVKVLVSKLPSDGHQKTPSCEVVVNMCGALNNLVSSSSLAARDISYFNGIPKLVGIKTSHDNSSGGYKAARAASTVLGNMFQYNKLHKDYKLKGFSRRDFTDVTI
ncbi:hypothetical protein fugu_002779 [Takifugu bimaculatus]|uniref:Plakophilin 3 n=1 Tax=Takifugu bimaculatus TaxID=433685 RepID=A0A4Z2BH70_9TELE|nr:hypothetical protein fugu_002779 [Takifugu bimaculatus]